MHRVSRVTWQDIGLLMLRLGIGTVFIIFGVRKLLSGRSTLTQVGGALETLGLNLGDPYYWGLLAALTELIGGALFLLGVLFRPACVGLLIVMTVAMLMLISVGQPMSRWSHAMDMGIVFASMFVIGPGLVSIKARHPGLSKRWYG